jgi:hypothetical protein
MTRSDAPTPVADPTDTCAEEALQIAISHGLPFRGLRNRAVDYRLFSYVPLELAQREALLPLSLEGDTLTIAAATGDPDLREITATFPALPVRLVIAPGREIRTILDAVGRQAA